KGHGAMQNNHFSWQRVAKAVPSHGEGMPGPGMAPGMMGPGMAGKPGMGPGMAGPGVAGLGPRFAMGRTQIRFTAPIGMNIAWQSMEVPGEFTPPQLEAPA